MAYNYNLVSASKRYKKNEGFLGDSWNNSLHFILLNISVLLLLIIDMQQKSLQNMKKYKENKTTCKLIIEP